MNKKLFSLNYIAAFAIIGLGMAGFPRLTFVWGALIIGLLVWAGRKGITLMAVTFLGVSLLVTAILQKQALPILLLTVVPGVAMGYAVFRFPSWGRVMAFGFTGGMVGFLLFWAYQFSIGVRLGMHPVETAFANYFALTLKAFEAAGLNQFYANQGITKELLDRVFHNFMQGLTHIRPALYILQTWFQCWLGLFCFHILARNEGHLHKKSFALQKMPWQLAWAAIAGLVLWLVGQQWHIGWSKIAANNILFLLGPIAFYFGLALVVYFVRQWRLRAWLIAGLVVLFLIVPLEVFLMISILGLFDSLIDYRKFKNRGNPA